MFFVPPSPCTEDAESLGLVWLRIFVFFLLWWTLYWIILRYCHREPEYSCRLVTLTHGILIVCLTFTDIIVTKQEFDGCCIPPLTGYQLYFITVTISYFIFDLLWINIFGRESIIIHFHHICSILLLLKVITSDTGGPGITYGLFGLEFTNPYLQARWFLRTHGYNNSIVRMLIELWFIAVFMIIRILGGTTLLYYVEIHPTMDLTVKIAFIGIYVISWLLVVQVFKFFIKKYIRQYRFLLSGSVLSIFPIRRRLTPVASSSGAAEDNDDT